jgi:hypothetical protein
MRIYAFLILSVTVLVGCDEVVQPKEPPSSPYFAFSIDPVVMHKQLAGRTGKFDGPGHGTQIEYFDPDGTAYLWYPGNRSGVPSEWKTLPRSGNKKYARICFRYPSKSYNPLTKNYGGRWECRSSQTFAVTMTSLFEGDEFDLKSGRIPKSMPRGKILDFEKLGRLIGRTIRPRYVYLRQ